ncbi:MAG TPA: hypothetical protein VLK58_13245, partial [Conexibacter sp.]|nr:hypothetical protein [Conexibacter sp.]
CALKRYNARDLDDLLTRYTSARTYYYNVTVLLDRVLFAPPSLRDKTRSELRVFAEDDQPRHEPRNSGSHLAAQLWARLKVAGAR